MSNTLSNITVSTHFGSALNSGISFDVFKLKGNFDPDVQKQCDAALASLKESRRSKS
jgi:hypothetical protein